jgi:hypothetical protein
VLCPKYVSPFCIESDSILISVIFNDFIRGQRINTLASSADAPKVKRCIIAFVFVQ